MVNLHALLPASRANVPGVRLTLWFQGWSRGCPGCFNLYTQDVGPRPLLPVAEVLGHIKKNLAGIEGTSLSGSGKPSL